MHKLVHTLGCSLLLIAPMGCAQQPAPTVGTGTESRGHTMDEIGGRVAAAAAKTHGWAPDEVAVVDLPDGRAGACRLVGARPTNVLSASTKTYAILHEREIVAPGDADALVRVLEACGDDASPALWADAVVAFADGLPPGRVARVEANISSDAHRGAIENGGYRFQPPHFIANDAVAFFMSDMEGGRLFEVRASRGPAGDVQVDARPAGG